MLNSFFFFSSKYNYCFVCFKVRWDTKKQKKLCLKALTLLLPKVAAEFCNTLPEVQTERKNNKSKARHVLSRRNIISVTDFSNPFQFGLVVIIHTTLQILLSITLLFFLPFEIIILRFESERFEFERLGHHIRNSLSLIWEAHAILIRQGYAYSRTQLKMSSCEY